MYPPHILSGTIMVLINLLLQKCLLHLNLMLLINRDIEMRNVIFSSERCLLLYIKQAQSDL